MSQIDDIIRIAGALVAGALALVIAWRSRSGREPDLSGTSKFVYNLTIVVIAAILATIVYDDGATLGFSSLGALLRASLGASILGVLAYATLSSIIVYEIDEIKNQSVIRKKIVGGVWLTSRARSEVGDGKTVQDFLREANYDLDRVWPRVAKGLGVLLVTSSYVLLMVGLSTALAASAALLAKATKDDGAPSSPAASSAVAR